MIIVDLEQLVVDGDQLALAAQGHPRADVQRLRAVAGVVSVEAILPILDRRLAEARKGENWLNIYNIRPWNRANPNRLQLKISDTALAVVLR
ncbi:hypothetical protein EVAR_17925_1 [Eumeta japonica]|uniref:Uncharacterized protein n=1 Tax=Eumeta variegata TaxID=151549 RepID=A0A4C1UZI8_EUMVA|nr:hypothetical protein EVAR_17925_1 [Eumeta japonica]